MENFLPFTDDVMVVLVHKCVQQTHLLALHLETLGYIPRLLNALNSLVYMYRHGSKTTIYDKRKNHERITACKRRKQPRQHDCIPSKQYNWHVNSGLKTVLKEARSVIMNIFRKKIWSF